MKERLKIKNWFSAISIVLCLMLSESAFGQDVRISGKVTDGTTNGPLTGATIQEKGTQNGTFTDASGNYTLTVKKGAVIVFSFVGYNTSEVTVGESNVIDFVMEESVTNLEEVVVTGYGKEKKVDLLGAISVVEVDKLTQIPKASVAQSLQGRVPGLYMENTGRPSGEAGTVLIRGLNTLGDNSPLYIIDGVPTTSYSVLSGRGTSSGNYYKNSNPLQFIDPNSILSIQVLKDASAASIYGARASSGVIIVTTKEGSGKTKVEFSTSATMQKRFGSIDVCDTYEHGAALWQATINDGTDPASLSALYSFDYTGSTPYDAVLNEVIPVEWINGGPESKEKMAIPGTDWQEEVYQTGLLWNTNLSISGGTDKSSAVLQLGYLKNQGVKKYSDYQRMDVRLNTSYKLFKNNRVKIGENLNIAKSKDTPEPLDLGGADMDYLAHYQNPFMPIYNTDGDWAGPLGSGMSDRNNPLHMLYIHRNNKDNNLIIFGNLYAEINLAKNLNFRSSIGLDYTDSYNWWIEERYTEGFLSQNTNSLSTLNGTRLNWTWSNTLNYSLTLNQHAFNFLVGMEAIKEDYRTTKAAKQDFALQSFEYFQLDAGTGNATSGGTQTGYQLLSYFGKANYNYGERYLASVTLRYDGSSRFGEENQFGLFPAFNVGWRISSEEFAKSISALSNLKIRAGIGRVGNQKIGNLARFGLYATNYGTMDYRSWYGAWRTIGSAYDLIGTNSGNLPSGFIATQQENTGLKWETTDELNIGVDFGFLNNSIYGSFDYFTRKSKDILIQPPYAGVIGEGGNRWENGASISNKGYEIVLGYRNKTGDFEYSITGSLSHFMDKVDELPESVIAGYPGNSEQTILGHSQSAIFGYVWDGIFQNQDEVDAAPASPGKGVGRLRFKDLNGDKKIDSYDQTWLGTTLPKYEYGFNLEVTYKGILTLSAFINGVGGKKIWDGTKWDQTRTYPSMNFGTAVFDAWTPQNPGSHLAALTLADPNNEGRSSDYMYVKGDYAKLRNLQLTYTLPGKISGKLKMAALRIYVMGENLFAIYHNKGADKMYAPDPEKPYLGYPLTRNYTIGLNVTF